MNSIYNLKFLKLCQIYYAIQGIIRGLKWNSKNAKPKNTPAPRTHPAKFRPRVLQMDQRGDI